MAARVSESFVLRTYPFREGDLIVSFFTRDQGKLRGVAARARKPKNSFGSCLERLSHANVTYYQKETRELVRVTAAELIQSQFQLASHYEAAMVLDYIAEISEHLLPPNETNEKHFRLMTAVLGFLHNGGSPWAAATYFVLWAVRLAGFLPDASLSEESYAIAGEILTTPVAQMPDREWNSKTARDLRRFLVREIENHVERRLHTPGMLEEL